MNRKPLIALALAAVLSPGLAAAQDTPRPDDRMAEREAEARLAVPRKADGTLDTAALANEIRARLAAGATEIQFRGDFSQQDAERLLADRSLLAGVTALLPNDGVERSVRLRGEVEARVQRTEEGDLRARIENVDLGNLTAAQRADLARQLAARSSFDRVRIRGTDANGERVRVEFRADRGIVRNEGRGDRVQRPERMQRAERVERAERMERAERTDRSGRR